MGLKLGSQVGKVFGRLTVIEDPQGYPRRVTCLCACGTVIEKLLGNLRNKSIHRAPDVGCGCVRREATIARNITHGMSSRPEYSVWTGMRKRCMNPNCKSYPDYGGRGIKICSRWSSFNLFLKDMGSRPSAAHTIERKNPNGDYCKRNCCWATKAQQNRNTRATRLIEIDGVKHCVAEWDEIWTASGKLRRGQFKSMLYHCGEARLLEKLARL